MRLPAMFLRLPLRAYPPLIRYVLRRQISVWRHSLRSPAPDLSAAELDFFFGGTGAVERRLVNPVFRFFSYADFEPPTREALDSILAHRLTLLGEVFDVGDPIQWRRDFRTGHEWPREHISKLQLVTAKGDVKAPWELSRFRHGVALALGYAATGDVRYVSEWAKQFHAWRFDNPPEYGPNWGNAMEAAIRAANWITAYEFLRPALDRVTAESLLKALIQHGRFIAAHLEEYWPPTNHLLANLCGLIWIGLFLGAKARHRVSQRHPVSDARALREPAHWLDFGLRELQKQLRFQILPDGASYEASTAYHRFVTEMIASTIRLGELNSVFIPPFLRETVAKMEMVVEGLRKPEGTLPMFGDEDGGSWLTPTPSPSPVVEERHNRGGESHVGWASFPHAGWFVHRNADEYLAIRAGDNGQAGWGGHAHNDALSFEYSVGARNFLVDPGTYTYTSDPETRNLFRSTAYHNTLRIDGQEISRIPTGELFRLENDARVKARVENECWEGEHSGYRRIGVTHRRRFERIENGWRIVDSVMGKDEHTLEWFFHFSADCSLRVNGLRVWTEYNSGPNICLASNLKSLISSLYSGWVSPTYGVRHSAPVVCYSVKSQLPVEVEFIITKL